MEGWRVLLSLLRPGGFMRIGLYSKLARQDMATARASFLERGYSSSAEDIRRCRYEFADLGDATPASEVTDRLDFFSISRCRDMLFHVLEHQFTLPEIADILHQNQLDFLGFDLHGGALQDFRRRFANHGAATDFALWHSFEMRDPFLSLACTNFGSENRNNSAGARKIWVEFATGPELPHLRSRTSSSEWA